MQADFGLRDDAGTQVIAICPAATAGDFASVWGTGIYTDDSSICTAAVHAGRIDVATGGAIRIEVRPGEPAYVGTTRNGVTTNDYTSWYGSFVFVP